VLNIDSFASQMIGELVKGGIACDPHPHWSLSNTDAQYLLRCSGDYYGHEQWLQNEIKRILGSQINIVGITDVQVTEENSSTLEIWVYFNT